MSSGENEQFFTLSSLSASQETLIFPFWAVVFIFIYNEIFKT